MKKFVFTLIAILSFTILKAQDVIHQRNGKTLKVKIIEVGTDEIKYLVDGKELPVFALETSKIDYITYADGTTKKFFKDFKDPDNYEGQLSKAIKMNFLSPLLGYAQFSFEKSISPLKSYEIGFGIIGAGKNMELDDYYFDSQYQYHRRNAFGGFLTAGYKFNKLPDYVRKGVRLRHIMQGTYVEPNIIIGYYKDDAVAQKNGVRSLTNRQNLFGGLLLNLGHQWVFGERFLVDLYGGLGYAFDNRENDDVFFYNGRNHFVIQKGGEGASIGLNGGIKIGLLIK